MIQHLLATLLLAVPLLSPSLHAAETRPILVELFTSQGCNSCPPADALLGELSRRPDLLALAFHVDYWDRLGWRDPFSSAEATRRQRDYARRLGEAQIYTPELVVDGRAALVGSDRQAVTAALAAARPTAPISIEADGPGAVRIGAGTGKGEVLLARYIRRAETRVASGENGGRTLVEYNVVRSLERLGEWDGRPISLTARLAGTDGTGADGIAVFIQASDGRILGARALGAG